MPGVQPAAAGAQRVHEQPGPPQDHRGGRAGGLYRRVQSGGRVFQSHPPLRPVEGHRPAAGGRRGAQPDGDFSGNVERHPEHPRRPGGVSGPGGGPGGRGGLRHSLRRQPAGRPAHRRGRVSEHSQKRQTVCVHHHAVSHHQRRDAAGTDAGGPAGRGCAHRHAGHPGQKAGLPGHPQLLRRFGHGGGAHLRVHAGLCPRQAVCGG